MTPVLGVVLACLALCLALPPSPGLPTPTGAVRQPSGAAGRSGPRWGVRPGGGTDHLRVAAVLGTATAVLLLVPGPEGLVAATVVAVAVWWRSARWEGAADRRRRLAVEAEVPLVADLMVAALRAGSGPAEALGQVAEVVGASTREELQVPLARLRLGADPVTVWSSLAGHPQLHRLGRTLARSAESGAPVAEALERLSDDLRARRRGEVEARVRQVEVKAAAPLGACFLPAFVLLGVVPLVAGSAVHLVGR